MVTFQLTVDCADPARMVAFWAPALGYVPRPAPDGFATWNDYYLSVGVPAEELDLDDEDGGCDRLMDPAGEGPMIWFQPVPEGKQVKNRLHLDLYPGGGRSVPREERMPAILALLDAVLAAGAQVVRRSPEDDEQAADGSWYRTLTDPEGNEFCIS